MKSVLFSFITVIICSCHFNDDVPSNVSEQDWYNRAKTVDSIQIPDGYERLPIDEDSFGSFLRTLELTKDNIVYYYDGTKKPNQNQYATIDLPVEGEYEQCADFVMKLRMLHLRSLRRPIVFYDNEGGRYEYDRSEDFNKYMQTVFQMCGTMSLSKSMHKRNMMDIQIGDVFIKGGFPGHVQIVVDVVIDRAGNKMFMLAEGYTPAQSPHIVMNLKNNSPWFDNNDDILETSGYTFTSDNLMTW